MTTLDKIKRQLERLNLEDLRALDEHLHALLDAAPVPAKPGAEVVDERQVGAVTYRLQRVKCGKPTCKCAKGEGHGPYWYAYWWEKGRTRSRYIGKATPEDLEDGENE